MTLSRYTMVAVALVLCSLALLWPLVTRWTDARGQQAVLAGALLAVANTVAAYGLVRWSEGRPPTSFVAAILGGMVGRMGMMLGAVLAGVLLLGLPQVPLVVSLLAYFAVFLVFELRVASRPGVEPAQ